MAETGYRWFVAMARVAEAEGDPTEALALLDRAVELVPAELLPGRSTDRGDEGQGPDPAGRPPTRRRLGR
jgi:hypothetical protein